MAESKTILDKIQATFKKQQVSIKRVEESEFPELIVTVPNSWPKVMLAPQYDAHMESSGYDSGLHTKHINWIRDEPNVLLWNGGDMTENATKNSPGNSVNSQTMNPEDQIYSALKKLAPIQHKMLFAIPGNHEDRTVNESGQDGGRRLADYLKIHYFPDYCFCTIKWRGNNFRIAAHHGSGGATTPGAQRNSARKDMPWMAKTDIIWTGHLHQPMVDQVFQLEYDQKTGLLAERSVMVIISPSYMKYFGGYAAKKRLAPGVRGLNVATLHADGRIDVSLHARGVRL